MNFVSVFMAVFSVIGGIDRIIGNKFGLGEKFEKGFMLFGNMALAVIGMVVISPLVANLFEPIFDVVYNVFHIDPSIIPASLIANDMGGASLSMEVCADETIGMFNALVVSAMMGATFSFSIPYALGVVKQENHKEMFLGFLCGVVTIPIGCIVSGFVAGIPFKLLFSNLLMLIILSTIIACGLIFCPMICVKIFSVFGKIIKTIITIGLILGLVKFLAGVEVVEGLGTLEEGAAICLSVSAFMSGAFVFLHLLSKVLEKPLSLLGNKLGINETSALGFISTLATNITTFEMLNDMDKKGIVLNSAFSISAAFMFAAHLAFTMAFNAEYLGAVMAGKFVAGLSSIILAVIIYNRMNKR